MTDKIPKALRDKRLRFTKINNNKRGVDKGWQLCEEDWKQLDDGSWKNKRTNNLHYTKDGKVYYGKANNYRYDDPEFIKWVEDGEKFGLLCGVGSNGLVVVDADTEKLLNDTKKLPETFREHKDAHVYFWCPEIIQEIKLKNDNTPCGEIKATGRQVVVYPDNNDYNEITSITKKELLKLLDTYIYTGTDEYTRTVDRKTKPKKIFKDGVPCKAVIQLIKQGVKKNFRNPAANIIVQQLRNYCGADDSVCLDHLKVFNNNCIPPKPWSQIKSDYESQKTYTYENISCNSLKDFCPCIGNRTLCKNYNNFKYKYSYLSKDEEIIVETPSLSGEFKKAITNFVSKVHLAEQFIKIQPVFYERKGQFWVWDFESYCWKVKDETDILNLISHAAAHVDTVKGNEKNEILESLKQVGRKNKPLEIKPTWVQFKNKIYDIENGQVLIASPKYFVSNPIDLNVGKSEKTPEIDELLKSWVGEKNVNKLYEIIAFTIVPKYFIHSFFFLYSPPGMGKSTFTNLIIRFLGKNNCVATSIDRINYNSRFETYNWHKKLLITLSEVSDANDLKNSGLINQATGEDPLRAEIKGGEGFDFMNYGKFIYPTNRLLQVDKSDGFGRRVRRIDFINRFEKEEDVLDKIPDWEYENLAKKCIRIAGELWKKRQFIGDTTITERIESYHEESKHPIEKFIENNCEFGEVDDGIPFDEFYSKLRKENITTDSKILVSKLLTKKLGYTTGNINHPVDKIGVAGKKSTLWLSKNHIMGIQWRIKEDKSINNQFIGY